MLLDFRFGSDPAAFPSGQPVDLGRAGPAELLFSCFRGDIRLRDDSTDLSTEFGWVPALDVAINLPILVDALRTVNEASYCFTESDDRIFFHLRDRVVSISCTYRAGCIRVDLTEFEELVGRFARDLWGEIRSTYPEISRNPFIDRPGFGIRDMT